MTERVQGQIKKWFDEKGFGFIRCGDDGSDLFVHISATGFLIPKIGARVTFERGGNPRTGKLEAKSVAILD